MLKKFLLTQTFSLLVICLLSGCSPSSITKEVNNSGIIDADNPYIQYIGRFNFSDPKSVEFDWPGVYICAKFEGTSCAIRLDDHNNEYAVVIDNKAPQRLHTDTSKIFNLVPRLNDSYPHTIMIQKRTESFVGKGEFEGFILDKGRTLLPPEKRPERRIEFIGNSITCGYGVEGKSTDCHFSIETENACMSYASITARALNADYHLVSYSGRGVVRNYGDSNKTSVDPMPSIYDRTCFYDSTLKWDFLKWIPQAVVINLGTNDFSTKPYPDKNVFQKAYLKLIYHVRSLYPGVTIFCICGPMIAEPCTGYIKEVIDQDQKDKRDKDVFFIEIKSDQLDKNDWGCDYHPNIGGMFKMSDIIVPVIRSRMNW